MIFTIRIMAMDPITVMDLDTGCTAAGAVTIVDITAADGLITGMEGYMEKTILWLMAEGKGPAHSHHAGIPGQA